MRTSSETRSEIRKVAARSSELHDQLEKDGFTAREIGLVAGALLAGMLRELPAHEQAPATLAHISAIISGVVGR